jgi:hypothetical protein
VVTVNASAKTVRWFEQLFNLVREWWGKMAGWISIPFMLASFFNVFSQRLLFALLAYASLWSVVIAQARRLSELQKPKPSPNVTLRVGHDLIDFAHGSYWIRGQIENTSEYRAESCRVKFLSVEGQNAHNSHAPLVENGPLEWQGGGCEPRGLDPHEKLIFDIGIRPGGDDSPFFVLVFFGGNEVRRRLPSPGLYKLSLAVYGSNIRTTEKIIPIAVGKTATDIDFPS